MNKRNIFYYDEIFHTRRITKGYMDDISNCDSYIGAAIGWNASKDEIVREEYKTFEEKYKAFYGIDELKSDIYKKKFYECGIASLKKEQLDFYKDYFTFLENGQYIYLCVLSKLESVIRQIIAPYYGYSSQDGQNLLYIITKAIWLYRPDNVVNTLFDESNDFLSALKSFLRKKVREIRDLEHKELELNAFRQCLQLMDDNIHLYINFDWNYEAAFWGLKSLTEELQFNKNRISLFLDNEGATNRDSKTLLAARKAGFPQAIELDSKKELGVRMADLLCGFAGRIIRALEESYRYKGDEFMNLKLLNEKWFKVNEEQFELYKKIANIFFVLNNNYYMSFAGVYGDDISSFFILLRYFDKFNTYEDYSKIDIRTHSELFNDYSCQKLEQDHQRFGKPEEPFINKDI
jgi:hypothetical protein